MRHCPSLPRALLIATLSLTAAAATAEVGETYETPPHLTAAEALPAEVASGAHHRIEDPVHNDGLMNSYALTSKHGSFSVQGRHLLDIRIREIAALEELDRVSSSEVFLKAVGRSVTTPVKTAVGLVEQPVETVTGIPRGISNLFKSYKLKARDVTRQAGESKKKLESGEVSKSGAADKVADGAKSYAARYFGVNDAQRRWYAKLGVDPYTTNEPLREAVRKVARVDAAAAFGVTFAGIPSIPGIDVVSKTMDVVWKEDPRLTRERNRRFLKSLDLDREEIARFENNLAVSPTHQVGILALVRELDGVKNRGELIRRVLEVTSEEESLALIDSFGLLVRMHRAWPLEEILGGIRLPAARTREGRVLVCAGFDSIYWTPSVAEGAREIASAYEDAQGSERLVVLSGSASPRVRAELEALGWKILDAPAPATTRT